MSDSIEVYNHFDKIKNTWTRRLGGRNGPIIFEVPLDTHLSFKPKNND